MPMPEPGASIEFSLTHSVIVVNPLHRPSPRLTALAARSGAIGVLELSLDDPRDVAETLDRTRRWSPLPFGVRIRPGCSVAVSDLPDAVDTVLLADPGRSPAEFMRPSCPGGGDRSGGRPARRRRRGLGTDRPRRRKRRSRG